MKRDSRTSNYRLLGAVCLLGPWLLSCSPRYLPNTEVEDNDLNRQIIEFCEEYRRAVERRNTAQLIQMAHPSYFEDGGNADSADDLDYDGLQGHLQQKFRQTRAIRYEIHYRRVSTGPRRSLLVDFTYSASYKIPTPNGDIWRRRVADNRLELLPQGRSFKILSGM